MLLEDLASIVRSRVREPYDWNAVWEGRPPYSRREFVPPAPGWAKEVEKEKISALMPVWKWAIPCVLAAVAAAAFGEVFARLGAVIVLSATAWWVTSTVKVRRATLEAHLKQLEAEYKIDLAHLRSIHEKEEEVARERQLVEDQTRERIRTAVERKDHEALTLVLEHELQNESLPFPYSFDIEMDEIDRMTIRLVLPAIDVVPEHRTALTKRGKLSTRALTQRDRVALYADICTGLGLRLAYETFRVLPCMSEVTIYGDFARPDPSTGHSAVVTALYLQTTRDGLSTVNLDTLDPSSALSALGGRIACDRRGELGDLFPGQRTE